MTTAPDSNDVNDSAAATLIHFDHPLPLLREPIRAGTDDDPSLRPNLLTFRNPKSFFSAQNFCRSKLLSHVRIDSSLAAFMKCKPPWWKLVIGVGGSDIKERESCEEREMANCLEESKGKCEKFAEEKTSAVFRSARVAQRKRWKIRDKAAADFVGWISLLGPYDVREDRAARFSFNGAHVARFRLQWSSDFAFLNLSTKLSSMKLDFLLPTTTLEGEEARVQILKFPQIIKN